MLQVCARLLAFACLFAISSAAHAACETPIAGPPDAAHGYFYASACRNVGSGQFEITARVCSHSEETVGFHWTKLNWSSGSQGVSNGFCLRRTDKASAIAVINGSALTTTVAPVQVTDVYLPDLNGKNEVYSQTVEGGTPAADGGFKEAYQFRIEYARKGDNRVSIRATVSGGGLVFYLVLPKSVRTPEDLRAYLGDDAERIGPLVRFEAPPVNFDDKTSAPLVTFLKQNAVFKRATVKVEGGDQGTSLGLSVKGDFLNLVSETIACVGRDGAIFTCLGASTPEGK